MVRVRRQPRSPQRQAIGEGGGPSTLPAAVNRSKAAESGRNRTADLSSSSLRSSSSRSSSSYISSFGSSKSRSSSLSRSTSKSPRRRSSPSRRVDRGRSPVRDRGGGGRRSRHSESDASPKRQPRRHSPTPKKRKVTRKQTSPRHATAIAPPRHRHKPGARALKEIRQYQASTDFLIPRRPFSRLVREITSKYNTEDSNYRYTPNAFVALQCAAEAYLVGLLEDSYLCGLHGNRVTLQPKDLHLARRLRGRDR